LGETKNWKLKTGAMVFFIGWEAGGIGGGAGVGYLVSGVRYRVSGVGYQVYQIRAGVSEVS